MGRNQSTRERISLVLIARRDFLQLPQEGKGSFRAGVTWEDAGRRQDLPGPLKDEKELVGRGRTFPMCGAV